MFEFLRSRGATVAVKAQPEAIEKAVNKPDAGLLANDENLEFPSHEYMQLAERAGYEGAKTLSKITAFRRWLAESGICVYDTPKVAAYLHKIKPANTHVRWDPIATTSGYEMEPSGHMWNVNEKQEDAFPARLYVKPIPDVVLMTVAKICGRWDVKPTSFFVSDFNTPYDDPFLGVWFEGTFYIIERWDEPGFRM